jgi:hypothetical protein
MFTSPHRIHSQRDMKPVTHCKDYEVNIRITEEVVTMLVYCLGAIAQTHLIS